MRPLISFNGWIMGKIIQHLTNREGFSQVQSETTSEGYKSLVEDAFGFRYEIVVKTVGRKQVLPDSGLERTLFELRNIGGA